MELFIPNHQFEVTYSPIIDFPKVYRDVISPFIVDASGINIDNEGLVNERLHLLFQEESYELTFTTNRIMVKFNALKNFSSLVSTGSIVDSVVFTVLKQFREFPSFGKLHNFTSTSTLVAINEDFESVESNIAQKISEDFLIRDKMTSLTGFEDISIMFENFSSPHGYKSSIHFGPYLGSNDLRKRQINIDESLVDISKKKGYMAITKVTSIQPRISFTDYKNSIRDTLDLASKIEYFDFLKNHKNGQ